MPNPAVTEIFRKYLGRDPDQFEYDGFSQAISNGVLDPVGLSLFVQSTAEFQRRNAPQMAKSFNEALGGADQGFLDQTLSRAYNTAQAQFRRMGRPYSSGLESRFAKEGSRVAGDLAQQRQGYVGNYLSGAYAQATRPDAAGIYGASRDRQYQLQDQAREERLYNEGIDRAYKQSRENQWFQLGGSLLSGAGSAYGGYLSGLGKQRY